MRARRKRDNRTQATAALVRKVRRQLRRDTPCACDAPDVRVGTDGAVVVIHEAHCPMRKVP
jgi:hypothetical protein